MTFFAFLINLFLFLSVSKWANAVADPLSVPNNKAGIHILFPSEISDASKIVNHNAEGAWGYATIPIQASDRDRKKWQSFFDNCKSHKIIPIIRVATTPIGENWAEPNSFDLVDFANFLGDLRWPTKNRYVIIFNEVNRSDEFGGVVSPEKYADILSNAIDIFKQKSQDFFILPAGLDNAASNTKKAIHWKTYLQKMAEEKPDIFTKIDGWTSHSYPNPEFSARPDLSGQNKLDSYKTDLEFIKRFTSKALPVFITETGWSNKYLTDHQIALYYKYAISKIWSDPRVVAVTPFLLNAQDGPFKQFSFTNNSGQVKEFGEVFSTMATFGEPELNPTVIFQETPKSATIPSQTVLGAETKDFSLFSNLYNNLMKLIGLMKK